MRFRYLFLLSLGLTILVEYTIAYSKEDGDGNAIGMYFLVFLVPTLFAVTTNALLLELLKRLKNKLRAFILSLIPLILLTILWLSHWEPSMLDGDLAFVGISGLIGIGTTNLIWTLKQLGQWDKSGT